MDKGNGLNFVLVGFSHFDSRKLLNSLPSIDLFGYIEVILFVGGNDVTPNRVYTTGIVVMSCH